MLLALAGGVGAARLLSGLVQVVDPQVITAVVNVGDDMVLHGLHISPDIDTVIYTLSGLDNRELGWGLAGESWAVMAELEQLGGESWFRLGDRDLATHLYRTQRLSEGAPLSQVTSELARARGVGVRLLPGSDDPVRTRLTLLAAQGAGTGAGGTAEGGTAGVGKVGGGGAGGGGAGGGAALGAEVDFQHYFVHLRHQVAVGAVRFAGASEAEAGPGVLEGIAEAALIVVCPSNPIVSIGPIIAIPGVLEALTVRRPDIVAVSPIVAGAAIKGPADRLMIELGHEASVVGVARLYAPWAATLVIDEADAHLAGDVEDVGMRCVVAPTIMSSPEKSAALAKVVLGAVA